MKYSFAFLLLTLSGFAQTLSLAISSSGTSLEVLSTSQIASVDWQSSYALVIWKSPTGDV